MAQSSVDTKQGSSKGALGSHLYCQLCDVVCSSSDAYAAHMRGSKHQRVRIIDPMLSAQLCFFQFFKVVVVWLFLSLFMDISVSFNFAVLSSTIYWNVFFFIFKKVLSRIFKTLVRETCF